MPLALKGAQRLIELMVENGGGNSKTQRLRHLGVSYT